MTQAERAADYVTREELADAVQAICDHVDARLDAQMAFNRRFFLVIVRKLFDDPTELRAALDELNES